jgi:hypothetical protein
LEGAIRVPIVYGALKMYEKWWFEKCKRRGVYACFFFKNTPLQNLFLNKF